METLTAVVGASKAILSKHQIGQETYMQLNSNYFQHHYHNYFGISNNIVLKMVGQS